MEAGADFKLLGSARSVSSWPPANQYIGRVRQIEIDFLVFNSKIIYVRSIGALRLLHLT